MHQWEASHLQVIFFYFLSMNDQIDGYKTVWALGQLSKPALNRRSSLIWGSPFMILKKRDNDIRHILVEIYFNNKLINYYSYNL